MITTHLRGTARRRRSKSLREGSKGNSCDGELHGESVRLA